MAVRINLPILPYPLMATLVLMTSSLKGWQYVQSFTTAKTPLHAAICNDESVDRKPTVMGKNYQPG
jgi:hypothetical protein